MDDFAGKIFCQSCGMPLEKEADHGTEADGGLSPDYCRYCYQGGAFPEGQTMEDIIRFNLKFNEENGHPFGDQEAAEAMMRGLPARRSMGRSL